MCPSAIISGPPSYVRHADVHRTATQTLRERDCDRGCRGASLDDSSFTLFGRTRFGAGGESFLVSAMRSQLYVLHASLRHFSPGAGDAGRSATTANPMQLQGRFVGTLASIRYDDSCPSGAEGDEVATEAQAEPALSQLAMRAQRPPA